MARTPRDVFLPALVFSALALAAPVVVAVTRPATAAVELATLAGALALLPAVLLAQDLGWRGTALAVSAGVSSILASQVVLAMGSRGPEATGTVFGVIAGFGATSLVVGWLAQAGGTGAPRPSLPSDPETGLRSRVHMNVVVETAVAAAAASDGVVSAALIHLPRIDRLEATHGPRAKQTVMAAMAEVCRAVTPAGGVVGMWGAGRFLIVFPESDLGVAEDVARRIEADFAAVDLRYQPVDVSVRCSAVRGTGATRAELFAALEESGETGPRILPSAVVVSTDPEARTVARRALELNGLQVVEFEHLGDLSDEVERLVNVEVLVGEIDRPDPSGSVLPTAERLLPGLGMRILFVSGLGESVPSADPNTHVLPGRIAPEPIVSIVTAGVRAETEVATTSARPASPREIVHAPTRSEALLAPIVVADDEAPARRALVRSLKEIGFDVVEPVEGGAAAVERLSAGLPALLILDLEMPEVDGFDVLEAVEEMLGEGEYFPVLVVTGNDQWELRQRALRLGAKDFLTKPFDIPELGARAINLVQSRLLHAGLRDTNRLLEQRVQERTAELERAQNEILVRLAQAVEYRDDITGRHAQRVGELAEAIAREYGLPPSERKLILRAAPLHDIGKIAIPDAVLMKPGRLTTEERLVMEAHTTIGAKILANATNPAMETARSIALSHHEQWDGSGYPRGISGERIPIEGRIVAVADVLDVLTHARPYKGPMSYEAALQRIVEARGAHFDPDVLDAALRAEATLQEILGIGGDPPNS